MHLAVGDVVRDRTDQALGTVAGLASHPDGPLVAFQVSSDLHLADPGELDLVAGAAVPAHVPKERGSRGRIRPRRALRLRRRPLRARGRRRLAAGVPCRCRRLQRGHHCRPLVGASGVAAAVPRLSRPAAPPP